MERMKKWFFENIANMVTTSGLIATFWLLLVSVYDPEELWLIIGLAIFVGFTDYIDGQIAKKLKIESPLGIALDRVRDKFFICPILVILLYYYWPLNKRVSIGGIFTESLVMLVFFLEFLTLIAGIVGFLKRMDINSNLPGKKKVFLEFSVVVLWLLSLAIQKSFQIPVFHISIYFINLMLMLIVYFSIKSMGEYLSRYKPETNGQHRT